jgi:SAM-dependent methyltransferase
VNPRPDPDGPLSLAEVAEAWDRAADRYDSEAGHGHLGDDAVAAAWAGVTASLLEPAILRHGSVLRVADLGTGTGLLADIVCALGHEVVALDASPGMLQRARARLKRWGSRAEVVIGDAHDPAGAIGEVDAVISRHVLWSLTDPPRALDRWVAAVRPGGVIAAIDGIWNRTRPADVVVRSVERAIARARRRPQEYWDVLGSKALPLWHITSAAPVVELWSSAGLDEVVAHDLSWVDRLERRNFDLWTRVTSRWTRYAVSGRVAAEASSRS